MKRKIVGLTSWVFDLFHIGHLNLLKNAKKHCDELIVLVAWDEKTKNEKWEYPIFSEKDRMEIIRNTKYVDRVELQEKFEMVKDQKKYGFSKIFKWDDWKGTERWNVLEKQLLEHGVEVVFLPYTKTISSTMIRNLLEKKTQ